MQRVVVMYNLKEGVRIEDYNQWSTEVDQKITPRQNGVRSFEVEGSENGKPICQVFEIIEVENYAVWQTTLRGEGMSRIRDEWPNYGDPSTVRVIYGSKIVL